MKPVKVDPKLVAAEVCRNLLRDKLAEGGSGGCPVCLAGKGVSVVNRRNVDRHVDAHFPDDTECEEVWHANGVMHGLYVFPADEYELQVVTVDVQRPMSAWLWEWLHANAERVQDAGFTCFVRAENRTGLRLPRMIGYVDAGLYEVLRDNARGLGAGTKEWRAFADAMLAEVAATSSASAS